jgi:hypothetical protein
VDLDGHDASLPNRGPANRILAGVVRPDMTRIAHLVPVALLVLVVVTTLVACGGKY